MHPTESAPANPRREVPFPAIASPQPQRKGCHPKGRNEVEDVRSTLTPLERRLRSAPIPPTNSPEDPNFQAQDIRLSLERLSSSDRLRFDFGGYSVSDLEPRWFSGFGEPDRIKPDFHSRSFHIPMMDSDKPKQLLIRRRLQDPSLSPTHLIQLTDISAPNCTIRVSDYDPKSDSDKLTNQAIYLSKQSHSGDPFAPGLPLSQDPGDVDGDEIQATVEVQCADPACNGPLQANNLEVHLGQSPREYRRSRSIR